MKKILTQIITLFIVSISFSCATLPPEKPALDWFRLLPKDNSLYICITDPDRIRPLLNNILPLLNLNIPDIRSILRKATGLYAAVSFKKKEPPRFYITLIGRYSSFWIGLGLGTSNKWKKDPENNDYWKHTLTAVRIAQPDNYMLLITNYNEIPSVQNKDNSWTEDLSEAFYLSLEEEACTLFFPHFGNEIIPEKLPLNKKKLPVGEVLITSDAEKNNYSILAVFNLIKKENAQLFETTFKTFIIWLMRQAKIDKFTRRISVDTDEYYAKAIISDFSYQEIIQVLEILISPDISIY